MILVYFVTVEIGFYFSNIFGFNKGIIPIIIVFIAIAIWF